MEKRGNKHAASTKKLKLSCEALPLKMTHNLSQQSGVLANLNSHSMERTLKIPVNKITFK